MQAMASLNSTASKGVGTPSNRTMFPRCRSQHSGGRNRALPRVQAAAVRGHQRPRPRVTSAGPRRRAPDRGDKSRALPSIAQAMLADRRVRRTARRLRACRRSLRQGRHQRSTERAEMEQAIEQLGVVEAAHLGRRAHRGRLPSIASAADLIARHGYGPVDRSGARTGGSKAVRHRTSRGGARASRSRDSRSGPRASASRQRHQPGTRSTRASRRAPRRGRRAPVASTETRSSRVANPYVAVAARPLAAMRSALGSCGRPSSSRRHMADDVGARWLDLHIMRTPIDFLRENPA